MDHRASHGLFSMFIVLLMCYYYDHKHEWSCELEAPWIITFIFIPRARTQFPFFVLILNSDLPLFFLFPSLSSSHLLCLSVYEGVERGTGGGTDGQSKTLKSIFSFYLYVVSRDQVEVTSCVDSTFTHWALFYLWFLFL